jgi:hypothetical protein
VRTLLIDRSHFSGTDLDRDIVSYAVDVYGYVPNKNIAMDDSEAWQWEADEALAHMDYMHSENGSYFEVDENCLFLCDYADEDENEDVI